MTFVDGHCATHRYQNPFRGPSSVLKRTEDSLGRPVRGGHDENLNDLRHTFSVSFGVQRNFRVQTGILFKRNREFVVEGLMQHFLDVVPIFDETVNNQRSRQTRRKGAQYLYPALGWQLRNHHGGRVRPPRSPSQARSEVNTLAQRVQRTFWQKYLIP